jgi:hypothetical protein
MKKLNYKNNKTNNIIHPQVEYLGRWVNRNNFRAFVYNMQSEETLANSYDEFKELISSGIWFETKEMANSSKKGKPKDDFIRSDS